MSSLKHLLEIFFRASFGVSKLNVFLTFQIERPLYLDSLRINTRIKRGKTEFEIKSIHLILVPRWNVSRGLPRCIMLLELLPRSQIMPSPPINKIGFFKLHKSDRCYRKYFTRLSLLSNVINLKHHKP